MHSFCMPSRAHTLVTRKPQHVVRGTASYGVLCIFNLGLQTLHSENLCFSFIGLEVGCRGVECPARVQGSRGPLGEREHRRRSDLLDDLFPSGRALEPPKSCLHVTRRCAASSSNSASRIMRGMGYTLSFWSNNVSCAFEDDTLERDRIMPDEGRTLRRPALKQTAPRKQDSFEDTSYVYNLYGVQDTTVKACQSEDRTNLLLAPTFIFHYWTLDSFPTEPFCPLRMRLDNSKAREFFLPLHVP
jgi:hypothetical protein